MTFHASSEKLQTIKGWRDKHEFKTHVLALGDKLDVRVRSLAVRPMRNKFAPESALWPGNPSGTISLV
jgi:hypothetical protein